MTVELDADDIVYAVDFVYNNNKNGEYLYVISRGRSMIGSGTVILRPGTYPGFSEAGEVVVSYVREMSHDWIIKDV